MLSRILQLREHIYSRWSLMEVVEGQRMQNRMLLSQIHQLAGRKSLSLVVAMERMQSQIMLSWMVQPREHICSQCNLQKKLLEGQRRQARMLLSRIPQLAERKSLSLVVLVGIVVLVVGSQRL
jgi:hypothetical protein